MAEAEAVEEEESQRSEGMEEDERVVDLRSRIQYTLSLSHRFTPFYYH